MIKQIAGILLVTALIGNSFVQGEDSAPVKQSGKKHAAEDVKIGSLQLPKFDTSIVFVNQSKGVRKIYWLDFNGERRLYGGLKSGEKHEQQTYLGHPWLVTDAQDNALGLYFPDGQKRIIYLPE